MAGGKNITTYNMTDIYKQKLHSPRDKDGNIYYITKDGAEGLEGGQVNGVNSRKWLHNPKTVYNSPTNIRRIWFSAKNIIVEYYAAPKRGIDAKGNEIRGKLVEVRNLGGIDFRNKAKELLKLLSLGEQANRAIKEGNMSGIEITGNPLSSKGNYALNNVEEIYFDWTALISKDTEPLYATSTLGRNARLGVMTEYLNNHRLNNGGAGGIFETDLPLNLFLGTYTGNVNRNYVRLKRIVMISHLQDIIDKYMTDATVSQHVDTFDINHVTEFTTSWMDRPEIMDAIKATNSDVWITNIQGTESANKKNKKYLDGKPSKTYFMVKSSTFLFDDLVLGPKIDKYTSKVEEMIKEKQDADRTAEATQREAEKAAEAEARAAKDAEIEENGPQAGSVYELMENIKELHGLEVAKKAFAAVTFSLNEHDIKLLLASMPTDMQKMYNTARKNMKDKINNNLR